MLAGGGGSWRGLIEVVGVVGGLLEVVGLVEGVVGELLRGRGCCG